MKKYNFPRELLWQKYIEEKKSFRTIAKELGCGKTTIENICKKYNIPLRRNTELRKGMKFGDTWRENIKKNHARLTGKDNPLFGRKVNPKYIKRGPQHPCYGKPGKFKGVKGPAHPCWKGDKKKGDLVLRVRENFKYQEWRKSVYERDQYRCVQCGYDKGGIIQADHIIPLSFLIKEHKISNVNDALNCEALWDISNGRTLCEPCHKKTDTWGNGAKKFSLKK